MKQFITGIPDAMIEAARVDGAGSLKIFWRIVMPNVKPAWLTCIIFSFQSVWNDEGSNYITNAANGTKKDPTGVVQQIIDANGTDGINAVSRATCSSKAIVEAVNNALEEATKKEENKEENTVKTEDLQAVITKAEDLSEADYTAESWKTMQDALTAAKDALEKKNLRQQ